MKTKESQFTVTGMTCGNCVKHVKQAILVLPGIEQVQVDLDKGLVTVQHALDETLSRSIVSVIEDQGYSAKEA